MLRSHRVWFIPVAVTLAGFGLGSTRAIAQTTYPFEAVYDLEFTSEEIAPNISVVTVVGESDNAPYGLNKFASMNYAQLDPDTGVSTSGPDAAAFGLEGLPIVIDKLFSDSGDSLIGTSTAVATSDIENLTASAAGILTITDGEGKFSGAKGTLTLSDSYTISPDPTAPLIGQAVVSGSFQTPKQVPEPRNTTTLVGMGAIGVGFLLHRRSRRVAV